MATTMSGDRSQCSKRRPLSEAKAETAPKAEAPKVAEATDAPEVSEVAEVREFGPRGRPQRIESRRKQENGRRRLRGVKGLKGKQKGANDHYIHSQGAQHRDAHRP